MKRKPYYPASRQGGFSLIEVMIASIIIACVGLAIANSFTYFTRVSLVNRQTKKASILADMVMERYVVHASTDFARLKDYEVTNSNVAGFFSPTPPLGYDKFWFTTTISDVPGNEGLKKLDLFLKAPFRGSNVKEFHFFKFLSPVNTKGNGVPVDVYVYECADPAPSAGDDPSSYCTTPGAPVAGAVVRGPLWDGAGDTIEYTDASGYAYLRNIDIGAGLDFYVKKPGSNSDNPVFEQGYFVHYGVNDFQVEDQQAVTILPRPINRVVFKRFQRAARVTGTVVNNTPPGSTEGMLLRFWANGVRDSFLSPMGSWDVYTDALGQYTLNNLLPGDLHASVLGKEGSLYTIPPGSPDFIQGYVGDPASNPDPSTVFPLTYRFPAAVLPNPPVLPGPPLYVLEEGPLTIVTENTSGVAFGNIDVRFLLPGDGFRAEAPVTVTTDGTGRIVLGNVVPRPESLDFRGFKNYAGVCPSPSGGPYGYSGTALQACIPGNTMNTARVPVSPGYKISGVTQNLAGTDWPSIKVSAITMDGINSISKLSGPAPVGNFELCGVPAPGGTAVLTFSNSESVGTTFLPPYLHIQESLHDQPIPGATIRGPGLGVFLNNCPGVASPVTTNSNGDVTSSFCLKITFSDQRTFNGAPPPPNWNVGAVQLNDNIADSYLQVDASYFSSGSQSVTGIADNGFVSGGPYTVELDLISYPVFGTVRDIATGAPVQGLTVDGTYGNTAVTNASGMYSLTAVIYGRDATYDGAVYTVTQAGVDANGISYGASSWGTGYVPNPFDFASPLQIDLYVASEGAGL